MKNKGFTIYFGIKLIPKETKEIKKFRKELQTAQNKYLADERKKKLKNYKKKQPNIAPHAAPKIKPLA